MISNKRTGSHWLPTTSSRLCGRYIPFKFLIKLQRLVRTQRPAGLRKKCHYYWTNCLNMPCWCVILRTVLCRIYELQMRHLSTENCTYWKPAFSLHCEERLHVISACCLTGRRQQQELVIKQKRINRRAENDVTRTVSTLSVFLQYCRIMSALGQLSRIKRTEKNSKQNT